jgi:probable F420-dependent oxidoreductase
MVDLGPIGIWSSALRWGDAAEVAEAAAELEELGFGALWIPGGAGGAIFDACRSLLTATSSTAVATGILNIWMHEPAETAAGREALDAAFPGRFLLGLGVSHATLIDADAPGRYQRPYSLMVDYLDALDQGDDPVPVADRALAALGPRMMALSRDRSAGAHPYNVPVEHTQAARDILGPGVLLAPETAVVFERDADAARTVARNHLRTYLDRLPNYTNNLLRFGFTADDLPDGGSDRLVDALVAWGDDDRIGRAIDAHRQAGADHVCVQVLGHDRTVPPRAEWRRLAAIVAG